MNEYDQERFTEMAEELDAAREKIKCLEADLRQATAQIAWLLSRLKQGTVFDLEVSKQMLAAFQKDEA